MINPKNENFTEELNFYSSQAKRDLKLYRRSNCFLTFFEEDDQGKISKLKEELVISVLDNGVISLALREFSKKYGISIVLYSKKSLE